MPFLSGVLAVKDSSGNTLGTSRSVALKLGDGLRCTVRENGEISDLELSVEQSAPPGAVYAVKAVCLANIPNLSAWNPASLDADGVSSFVDGELVLLTAQTTKASNGPYLVGTSGLARTLTRPTWYSVGASVSTALSYAVTAGAIFRGTLWRAFRLYTSLTVGTDDPHLMPEAYPIGTFTVSGHADISPVWMGAVSAVQIEYTTGGSGADGIVKTSMPNPQTLRFTAPNDSYPQVNAVVKNFSY
jgi:hypothetical protein